MDEGSNDARVAGGSPANDPVAPRRSARAPVDMWREGADRDATRSADRGPSDVSRILGRMSAAGFRVTAHGVALGDWRFTERWAGDPEGDPRNGLDPEIPRRGFLRGRQGEHVDCRLAPRNERVLFVYDPISRRLLGALVTNAARPWPRGRAAGARWHVEADR